MQLEIHLDSDGVVPYDLMVPIVITMPAPAGLDPSRLEILHYNWDGTYE